MLSASIDSNDPLRDIQLRSPKGLDADRFPSIVFESTKVETTDDRSGKKSKRTFRVTGNLTLRGKTRKTTIPVELLAAGDGPDGKSRCGLISRFVVRRGDFEIDALKETVGDSIAVTFSIQAVRVTGREPQRTEPFFVDKTAIELLSNSERERIKELFRERKTVEDRFSAGSIGDKKDQ